MVASLNNPAPMDANTPTGGLLAGVLPPPSTPGAIGTSSAGGTAPKLMTSPIFPPGSTISNNLDGTADLIPPANQSGSLSPTFSATGQPLTSGDTPDLTTGVGNTGYNTMRNNAAADTSASAGTDTTAGTAAGSSAGGSSNTGDPSALQTDWNSYWQNPPALGTKTSIGGGNYVMNNGNGTASVFNADGSQLQTVNQAEGPQAAAASSPEITANWQNEGLLPGTANPASSTIAPGNNPLGMTADQIAGLGFTTAAQYQSVGLTPPPNLSSSGGGLLTTNPNLSASASNPAGTQYSPTNPDPNMSADMTSAANAYWNTPVGQSQSFAGGTLVNNGPGANGQDTATFTAADGTQQTINQGESFDQIAQASPAIGAVWASQYGFTPTTAGGNVPNNTTAGGSLSPQFTSAGQPVTQGSLTQGGLTQGGLLSTAMAGGGGGTYSANTQGGVTGATPTTTTPGLNPTVGANGVITPGNTGTITVGSPGTAVASQTSLTDPDLSVDQQVANTITDPVLQGALTQATTGVFQTEQARGLGPNSGSIVDQAVANAIMSFGTTLGTTQATNEVNIALSNAGLGTTIAADNLSASTQTTIAGVQAWVSTSDTNVSAAEAEAIAQAGNWTTAQVATMNDSNNELIQTNTNAANLWNGAMSQINAIMTDANLTDPNAKTDAVQTILNNLQNSFNSISAISGVTIPAISTTANGTPAGG